MKVFKYPLSNQGGFTISLPVGFKILHVGQQRNKPVLWALVDPNAENREVKFYATITGEKLPNGNWRHVGTFTLYKGDFVGHLFMAVGV